MSLIYTSFASADECCLCLFYPNSKCEHPPRPTRPPPPTPDTLPLKINGDPVSSVSLHLSCDSRARMPSSGRRPTHCFQEAFPSPGPAAPIPAPRGLEEPCFLFCHLCAPARPRHAATPPPHPRRADASSSCPEGMMSQSPVCRTATQALPGGKLRFPAGGAFRDRPLCPPLRGTSRKGRRIKI